MIHSILHYFNYSQRISRLRAKPHTEHFFLAVSILFLVDCCILKELLKCAYAFPFFLLESDLVWWYFCLCCGGVCLRSTTTLFWERSIAIFPTDPIHGVLGNDKMATMQRPFAIITTRTSSRPVPLPPPPLQSTTGACVVGNIMGMAVAGTRTKNK